VTDADPLTGGCACGAVRFLVSAAPLGTVVCRCTSCRRAAAAPFVPWTTVPAAALAWPRGRPRERESSPGVVRGHCADCGTTLTYARADSPAEVDVATCAFDTADTLRPSHHIWALDDLAWMPAVAGLPVYARSSRDEILLPAPQGVTLRRVDFAARREALMAVRVAVFVAEQGVPLDIEADERDAHAVHVLATDAAGESVATGRLDIGPDAATRGKIGRVAVRRDWRGRHLGAAVMGQLHRLARAESLAQVWCNAQLSAVPFYEKLGYVREGAVFEEAGIPHLRLRAGLDAVAP
jgi:predicted GNAT family N-acyltransferase